MTTNVTSPCCCSSPQQVCCDSTSKKPGNLDTICRVALAALALLTSPVTFIFTFVPAACVGAIWATHRIVKGERVDLNASNKPICAQGYMEMLSGMRFSATTNLVVTAAFVAAHIHHSPGFFVPFTGIFVGLWAGTSVTTGSVELTRWTFETVKSEELTVP